MSNPTYATVLAAVEAELDLEDEVFITPTDLVNFCNQGIHEAESIIMKLNEDYFLTSASLSMVSGTSSYSLPSDIYANKIKRVVYSDGTNVYEVKRLKHSGRFEDIPLITSDEDYSYLLKNVSGSGFRMVLYPAARTTSSSLITIWYIRNALPVAIATAATDEIEIPEFRAFIEKYMIMRALGKESSPKLALAAADFESEKKLMIDTLTERVVDDHNEFEMDLSHYLEHN